MCKDEVTGKIKNKHLMDIQHLINSFPKEVKIELPKYEFENDEVYPYKIIQAASNFSGWKKDIYDIIAKFPIDYFEIKDFQSYVPNLKMLHSRNNNVEAKIRQVLQQFRDLGLIKFEGYGKYMRLFR